MPKSARIYPATGHVRLRQTYSREGRSYCIVSIPIAVQDLLKWEPGMFLFYYPTKDGCLKLKAEASMLHEVAEDMDTSAIPDKEARLPSRPDSMQARAEEVEERMDKIIERLGQYDHRNSKMTSNDVDKLRMARQRMQYEMDELLAGREPEPDEDEQDQEALRAAKGKRKDVRPAIRAGERKARRGGR